MISVLSLHRKISSRRAMLLTLLITATTALLFAQEEVKVNGIVLDANTGKPLQGADVYLLKAGRGAATDEDGYFQIEGNFSGLDTLIAGFVGYREARMALRDFNRGKPIRLKPVSLEQQAVTIQADRIDLVNQEIPHSRSEFTVEEIELRGSSELSDLVKSISSVRIQGNDLNGRSVQIRGSDADEVNVYVDGILINNAGLDNAADLSIVPVESIEKIELLKGSNLSLLGSGAFGGVVNITTRKNLHRSIYAKSKIGSFDTRYFLGELNVPISQRLVVNYFGQYNRFEPGIGYWETVAPEDRVTTALIETTKQNHNLSVNYYLENSELSNRLYVYNLDYATDTFGNTRDNYLLASSFKGRMPVLNSVDLSVNYNHSDDGIEQFPLPGTPGTVFNDLDSDRLTLRMVKKVGLANDNELNFLGEYIHDELHRRTSEERAGSRIDTYRAFLYENRWSTAAVAAFSNRLGDFRNITYDTHAGLRGDFIANGDVYLSPSLGGRFRIINSEWELVPYANFGRNVKIQTLLDNAYVRLLDVTQSDTSFARLRPELNNAFEFGSAYRYFPGGRFFESLDASLAFYRNLIVNKLVSRPGDVLTTQLQIGRNTTRGIEGTLALNRVAGALNIGTSFNLLEVSDRLLYAYKPKSNVNVQAEWISRAGFYLTTVWFYEGESLALEKRISMLTGEEEIADIRIEPYNDLDITLGYRLDAGPAKLNLQAAGYNIFDNNGYRDFLLKKRFYQLSLSVRY